MRMLFATDGSAGSQTALEFVLALPYRPADRVEVLSVPVHQLIGTGFEGYGAYVAEVMEAEIAEARRAAAEAVAQLHARGIETGLRLADGLPAEAILAAASAARADLIIVGSRGRGRIAGAILGSTARALARHSPIPVLVIRDRRDAPRRILVAVDGSADSRAAIAALAQLPLPRNAEVTLLHVAGERSYAGLPAGTLGDELRAAVEREERNSALEMLRVSSGLLPSGTIPRLEMERGPAADRVLAYAGAMGADLIVLGSRGATLGGGFVQGSTADRVLAGAHCAVLVARARTAADVRPDVARPLAAASLN